MDKLRQNSDMQSYFPMCRLAKSVFCPPLKMNLSSKEIANPLNVSGEGIKKARYRLRKKKGLNTGDSLEDRIMQL